MSAAPRSVQTPSVKRSSRVIAGLAFALSFFYIINPSVLSGSALVFIGLILVALRPDVAVIFLGFGWIGQRQVMTYSSGIPLLLVAFAGGLMILGAGIRNVRVNRPFFGLAILSVFFSLFTILVSPMWREAALTRLLSVAVAVVVYLLCSSIDARELFRIASICCGVIIAINAVIASRVYGQTLVHWGDINEFRLSDANYGSLPIVFGMAIGLQYLFRADLRRWKKILLLLSLAVMFWGILVLASRGAQLSVALMIILWLVTVFLAPRSQIGTATRMTATILVAVSIGGFIISQESAVLTDNRGRWKDALPSGGSYRSEIYLAAIDALRDRPLDAVIGGGIGHNLDVLGGRNAHNQILDTLFDNGIFGVLVLIWLWGIFLFGRTSGVRGSIRETDSTTIAAVGLGVSGLLISPLWFTFFWIEIGYLAACSAPGALFKRIPRNFNCSNMRKPA